MNKVLLFKIVLLILVLFYLFYLFSTITITARFDKLEPFKHRVPVYYNGFKLGYSSKVYPDENFQATMVDLVLSKKNLKLPLNTIATLKRKDKRDYIELQYPNASYLQILKNKDIIDGHTGMNFESFLQEQSLNGGFDEVKDNVNKTINSAGDTFQSLTAMIKVITEILEDSKPAIKDTVQNLNRTSQNLADCSNVIKENLQNGKLDNSLSNVENTTKNLVSTTENLTKATKNLNENTINLINCTIGNINILVENINKIVIGIGENLSKSFGGLRVIFSKSVK